MAWLVRESEVLASAEVASGIASRMRGLIGRDDVEGALILRPAKAVHTIGMRFAIDVAFCNRDGVVLCVKRMARFRIGRPRMKAKFVIEAKAGAFERWKLQPGDELEVRE